MPFITEESEGAAPQELRAGGSLDHNAALKIEQVAKELDGFSHVLKRERDSWVSQSRGDAATGDLDIVEGDEVESISMDFKLLQTVLQEVEHKLERARNGSKREYNQHAVRLASRQATYDSGISDMSTSPKSRHSSIFSISPTIQGRPGVPVRQPSLRPKSDSASPSPESRQALLQCQLSSSPKSSPTLAPSPPTSYAVTSTSTAATTPIFTSPTWNTDTGTRPPSIILPPAATDWSLFCNEAQVICEGWQTPWTSRISQRRRVGDCGLSLRAERADGSYLYHDVPAFGIAIPHTKHTGANPRAKYTVSFLEPYGHNLRKVTSYENKEEREPKYIFQTPEDHQAFQELIYGCDLVESWDIISIKSDREKESTTQTLRLWRGTHTRVPLILFYTNTRKRSAKLYIQEPSMLPLLYCLSSGTLTTGF